jgi:hypothetical protein
MADTELQHKTRKPLPPITATWIRTSVPEPPVTLPIGVTFIIEDALTIHAERVGSLAGSG